MEQVVMNTRHSPARRAPTCNSHQRGVVLFIALIVMVAMSLAAIALMRSVDTTSAVIGNLAFRQASILPGNFAIEDAAAGLFSDANVANVARIPDLTGPNLAPNLTQNYYPTHPPIPGAVPAGCSAATWDDKYGVPCPLQTQAKAQTLLTRNQVDGAGNTVTYVIERMCNPNAPAIAIPTNNSASRGWCDMMPPQQPPGTTINDPSLTFDFKQVYYRVTVRIDGPPGTNTVSFAQAMLR
jgi:type IV pilus assembly protein PilX